MNELTMDSEGNPLAPWDLPPVLFTNLNSLPLPDEFRELMENGNEEDGFSFEEVGEDITCHSYNDGGGNGFDILTSPRGTLLLALDHELDEEIIYKHDVLSMIPSDLRKLAGLGLFSMLDDDCPVGTVAWSHPDDNEVWHAGILQEDNQLFDVLKGLS